MSQQITYQERPVVSTGGKIFLILEMVFMILAQLATFFTYLFTKRYAMSMIKYTGVFLVFLAAYILLLIGTSKRNNIGVQIAGLCLFLLLEWESYVLSFTSFQGAFRRFLSIPWNLNNVVIYIFTFVWISMIILACIKKAPKALCIIPGIIGILGSLLLLYLRVVTISRWSSLTAITRGMGITTGEIFYRTGYIIRTLAMIFRPFWIFMVSHWLTHPTKNFAVRPQAAPVYNGAYYGAAAMPNYQQAPQPQYQPQYQQPQYQPQPQYQQPQYQPQYQPQPQYQQPQYQPVTQTGYQQAPQQTYPAYTPPQQLPPPQ